jgi:hypothetical protein
LVQFREQLSSIIADKHQTLLIKMGAILGTGIIDAGGKNCLLDFGSSWFQQDDQMLWVLRFGYSIGTGSR